ncbi:MAG: DNA cytosine methyltransferase [Rhodospirillum sp.]|nr:DNA cytosine methyltransferase [Rhodospirillum sp.]MCF8489289.1 DNA cytosine methyltransferase [Rhodospirillum sp.]MCF8502010.1 DNA cytosine methyltransferase [Rhodospirillum sp.]
MRSVELFAGAGGLAIGVGRAGFIPSRIVEWDRWCCDTLRENRAAGLDSLRHWPLPQEGDVRSFTFTDLDGKIDIVTGGPPCQPFSLGGKHQAHADKRDMWSEAVRVVRETRPKAFLFENVKGLTRASFNAYFSYILRQLTHPEIVRAEGESWDSHFARLEKHYSAVGSNGTGLGYNVVHRVLNAADYGVPQRRERVLFVGFRSDLGIQWSFPRPTHSRDALLWDQVRSDLYWDRHRVSMKDRALAERLFNRARKLTSQPEERPWRTVRDAISDLPDPEHESLAASSLFSDHRFQAGARSYPGHTGSPFDEPAKTLKAGVHGVPGGENMLARPDGSVRYFSIRESARLQTFPDDFRFHGAWSETMRQMGNAVPVCLAEAIAKAVHKTLRPFEKECVDRE